MALAFRSPHHDGPRTVWTIRSELLALQKKYPSDPASTGDDQPIIPPASLFSTLQPSTAELKGLPSVAECAVHLELLEAFLILKQKVLTSNALDRTFGLVPKDMIHTVNGKKERKRDPGFEARRNVKWPIFLRIASARFLKWFSSLSRIMADEAGVGYEEWEQDEGRNVQLTVDTLPPLGMLFF